MPGENLYTADSIQKMDPLTFTRHRPDSYLGSNEDSTQLVREIVSNSVDEFLIGNCTEIVIEYDEQDNCITVHDNGQGIIPDEYKDGKSVLELVYGDINTSGKYDKSDSGVYKISTGAFGIGSSLTNFLSHWLMATTKRNGKYETVWFNEGRFEKRETGRCAKSEHGVHVSFVPNGEFFQDAKPNVSKLQQEFFNASCVCAGLKITLNDTEFYNPDGLKALVLHSIGDESRTINKDFSFMESADDCTKLDFYMTATGDYGCTIIPFCNYSLIESGTPVSVVKAVLTRVVNKWAREKGLLKEKDKNLDGSSIQDGLTIAFNLVSQRIRYDSQTKVRVTSTDDNAFISDTLSRALEVWLDNNPSDGKEIVERALMARRAAEAAKKARDAVRSKAASKDKVFKLPTSLVDCWTKDRTKAELLIAEGKSAASNLVAGRKSEYQAVYGVKGKMLNLLKTTPEKIMKNQEINNLVVALGLDYDIATGKCVYNASKLRYGKIVACADADFDGFAIENLLFNIIWYICPELIINGHVYSAVPPLYRITTKKNEYVYLSDDKALEEYKRKHKDGYKINRNKGLGEQDTNELSYCLLDPKTRVMHKLVVSDIEKTNKMFQDLYGKNVEPRVRFLEEHLEEAHID